jgi:hypothetical protein
VVLSALAVLLGGCTGIKPGSYKLNQPAGIGTVGLQLTVCTIAVGPPPPGSEIPTVACGPPEESGEAQMLATLVVPTGTVTPVTFNAAPGPGAVATTFARSPELTAKMNATEFSPGSVGPPPGFELAGYTSGPIAESVGQEFTWTIATSLALPPGPGGGSYGGPLKATMMMGWRKVSPELPASRPINCKEEGPGAGFCGGAEPNGEVTLGVSDLKVAPPPPTSVVPGAKVTLPFVLDFASSAAELPKFTLALASTMPNAGVSLSGTTFSRGPADPTTRRAPPTTRKAIVRVPTTARLGSYELNFTATANQGGVVNAATKLVVKPKGRAKLTSPKSATAKVARTRGIPVELEAPIAGTRFRVVLRGPGPGGKGRAVLLRKVRTAKEVGTIDLRLRIASSKADEVLAAGGALQLEAKVTQPGTKKPRRLARTLRLR